ncbi:hypothetical protein BH09PSE5_BH09PSE5_17110 [soil metagenome]
MARLTLLANHVIAAEPVAQQRLLPHAGRTFALELVGWPSLLPAAPSMVFAVTPAGLLEWLGEAPPPQTDLRLLLDASNPVKNFGDLLRGVRPRVDIDGDATLATDLSWLTENLRWDVTDDLSRVVGPGPAHELAKVMRAIAGGLSQAVGALRSVAGKLAAAIPAPLRPSGDPASDSSGGTRGGKAGRPGR